MAQQKNIITVIENGPLQIEGEVKVYNTVSELVADETPVALCRCGASNNKPFCDGSHEQAGFVDCCQVDSSKDEEPEAYTPLTITCRPNGMLVVKGPMTIIGPAGTSKVRRNKAALCRCGASRQKPFCDISHKKINFIDDALLVEDEPESEVNTTEQQAASRDEAVVTAEPGMDNETGPTPDTNEQQNNNDAE